MPTLRILFLFTINLIIIGAAIAQELYSKSFGEKQNPAIVYLHGGPGYNCSSFERTTAQTLADEGYHVIVYDRRGEGRSQDSKALYNFEQTFEDLNTLYVKYGVKQATVLGHSFGGMAAIKYAEQFPEKVKSIVLIGAPIYLQETFKTIIASCKEIYTEKDDEVNLGYIDKLEKMATASLMYASYCFMHAMQNGFYSPAQPSEEALQLYGLFRTDSVLIQYASKMGYEAPQGFWTNEHYTTMDMTDELESLLESGTKVYGLYGKEDGLYSENQIMNVQNIIGAENLMYLDNCSHSVYIDQQTIFINALKEWD